MLRLWTVLAILLTASADLQLLFFGPCPSPFLKRNFDISIFAADGPYYEVGSYSSKFNKHDTCVKETYTAHDDGFSIEYSSISKNGTARLFRGEAEPADGSGEPRFTVTFGTGFRYSGGDKYDVLFANRVWALIWNCQEFGEYNKQILRVLATTRPVRDFVQTNSMSITRRRGLDPNLLSYVQEEECTN